MCADDGFSCIASLQSLPLTKAMDEDLIALVSNLVDQNSELQKKLQELNSQKERVDKFIEQAHNQAKEIVLRANKEAQDRAAAIIIESQAKAELEANNIIAEGRKKADDIAKEQIQSAIYQGSQIIDKAQEKALSIIEEAQSKVEAILNVSTKRAKHIT
jgi:vacuolar-type H+-ATPase subunit H